MTECPMARTTLEPKDETVTFRIAPALKQKQRREFEAEARRQCLAANAAARDSNSDEAAVMRELDADLEEFSKEWK